MLLKDLCEKYGESYSVLVVRCRNGKLPAKKKGKHWDVKVCDYKAWKKAETDAQKKKINNSQCRKCKYGMSIDAASYCCNYLEITGRMRRCSTYPVCEKFELRTKCRRRTIQLPSTPRVSFQ